MTLLKRTMMTLMVTLPALAMAHPGHEHQNSFWNGFIHPFTGLDHLSMVIALGVLLATATKKWKMLGLVGFAIAMSVGFALGHLNYISSTMAEYGIILSLLVLSFSLLSKTNHLFAIAGVVLASFHGVAHGVELGHSSSFSLVVLGMLSAMALIYVVGLGLGKGIATYMPHGKKIVAGLTALVALIGLA